MRAWTILSCAWWCTMHGFMHSLGITHARRLRVFSCTQDRVALWLLQHLMLLKMAGRSPREATLNNSESWKRPLQHEGSYSTTGCACSSVHRDRFSSPDGLEQVAYIVKHSHAPFPIGWAGFVHSQISALVAHLLVSMKRSTGSLRSHPIISLQGFHQ